MRYQVTTRKHPLYKWHAEVQEIGGLRRCGDGETEHDAILAAARNVIRARERLAGLATRSTEDGR
jgi:hypothetical protein